MLSDAELSEALRIARVPRVYHDKAATLRNYGDAGSALADWVQLSAAQDIATGNGKFIVGTTPTGEACFFTLARSLTLCRFSVKVYSLPMLAKRLGSEDLAEELEDVSALLVAGFYEQKHAAAFSAEKLYELEWFFRSRWNNNMANIFLASHPILACDWWSDGFLEVCALKSQSEIVIAQPKAAPVVRAVRRPAK